MTTPATGFLRSLPETLQGIVSELDAKLAIVEEQRANLLRDRHRTAEILTVARMAEANPDAIRLLDGTTSTEERAA